MSNNTLKLKDIHYTLNGLPNSYALLGHETKVLFSCYSFFKLLYHILL